MLHVRYHYAATGFPMEYRDYYSRDLLAIHALYRANYWEQKMQKFRQGFIRWIEQFFALAGTTRKDG